MLKLTEDEFLRVPISRIIRAMEWIAEEDERRHVHTRLLCYYMGNHKASSVSDMWPLYSEIVKKQRDLAEGKIPMATFRKLSEEEVKNWNMN